MKTYGMQLIAELHGCPPELLNDKDKLQAILTRGIEACGFHQVSTRAHKFEPIGVTVISIINESHIAIHTYPEAHHASVDIFHCSTESEPLFELLNFLKYELNARSVKYIEVTRGNRLETTEDNYITSAANYGFEVRYLFTRRVMTKSSKYHKIEVVDNENFGRMLFLDGDLQLAEKDVHLYNQAMVAPLLSKNKLGRVAILGGGDGGVLNELLKHDPGRVTLIDIDGEVIETARKYFTNVCGHAFDDPRAEIVVGDANEYLENHSGFEAVIYDLTTDPELLTNKDKRHFMSEMLAKVRRSLVPGGLLSMQCCSEHDLHTFDVIKEILAENFESPSFKTVFIPSYCEPWVFASAIRK